jgi:hypothetical protein
MNGPHKYGVVRALAFILKLLAWLALLAGVLVAIAAGVSTTGGAPPLIQIIRSAGLIVGPVVGVIWFVQLFAFGSILSLLVDIEENTRVLAAEPSAYEVTAE